MDPWITFMVLAIAALAIGEDPQKGNLSKDSSHEPKLVCYYSNWAVYRPGLAKFTPENINPYLCTHIIYAFASLSEEFELQPFDPYNDVEQGNYRSFVNLKSFNPNLKTLVAVGGWNEGSRRFSKLVETEKNRRTFVVSAIQFLREFNFDGLDLDWEYPAFREGGNQTTDKKGYALLIKELRHAIENERPSISKEKLLLSVAVPATKEYIDGGFDVPQIAKNADFLNLLTYDYHSAYEPEAQHHAPLLATHDKQLNVAWTVNYYLSLGAPRSKLVVGVPLYGRSYTLSVPQLAHGFGAPASAPGEEGSATREKGYLAYYEICQKVKDEDWEVEAPSSEALGPFAHRGDQWVGFDDEEMLLNKARYILDNNLGGAMIWTLDNDDFRGLCTGEPSPLVSTVRDVLLGSNLIAGSSSRRSVARSAEGPQERSSSNLDTILRFDDEASSPEEEVAEPPRRRNTLRRLVQNRQAARNRQAAGRRLNTGADENALDLPVTTPVPPPTPDPGVVAFECEDEGFFNNPRDCRKYFWCLDSGPANLGVVAHAFTCPSGLHFNSNSESCDYPTNVVCPVGSTGSSPAKATPRARTRTTSTTTTTTTTTEPPTTTTEEPADDVPDGAENGGENVAELLRLLQSIGGVERLQSLLGAQGHSTRNLPLDEESVPHYVTPRRSTTNSAAPKNDLPRRRPQHDASSYLDPDQNTPPEDSNEDEEETDFDFRYKTPSRRVVKPEVVYVDDNEYDASPTEATTPGPTAPPQEVSSRGPYRTPIRVQVGRVVRVQNGSLAAGAGEALAGGRRRMLVRVRPSSSPAEEGPTAEAPQVTGRAVGGDERRHSGSSLLATRDNPIGAAAGSGGETRVSVRRRPVYNAGEPSSEDSGRVVPGIRLFSRRPSAVVEVAMDGGNYVQVGRRPTTTEVTTPLSTTTTTTTTTTTPVPEDYESNDNSSTDAAYEYDDEYYDEYEDETTPAPAPRTTTTTTSRPGIGPTLSNRRRLSSPKPRPVTSVSVTPSSRSTTRRGSSPAATTTTSRPAPKPVQDDDGPPVDVVSDDEIVCHRRGVFIHPTECSKFVLCAPVSRSEQTLKGRVLNCPANQIYLVEIGRCMKGDRSQCQRL